MTNPIPKKISELPTLGGISDGDLIPVVDISDTSFNTSGETKKVSYSVFKATIQQEIDTDFVEEDPVFIASVAGGITSTNTEQWDAAYGWGNHAAQGYLQSISAQSIDLLNDVDTSTVTAGNILKWNGNSWVAAAESQGTTINGLNDVGDVEISGPTGNQVLRYDSDDQKWKNQTIAASIGLASFSVSTNDASSSPSLSYDDTNGVFTYTPPDLSSLPSGVEIKLDLTPELGGDLDLSNKTIEGTGTINITGDVKSSTLRLSNNATTPSSGSTREIKVIGNAPHFYDGTAWRPFFLINEAGEIPADTLWDSVLIRATFDTSFDDIKYNATPYRSSATDTLLTGSPVKVGVKALRLDDAYIEWDVTDTTKYDFVSAWTMEAWVYIDDINGFNSPDCIFGGNSSTASKNWGLKIRKPSSTSNITFSWFNGNNSNHNTQDGTDIVTLTASTYIGSWHHIAYVKDGLTGDMTLYLDGENYGSVLTDNNILNPDEFALGYQEYYGEDFDGIIDDLRISKTARYNSTFIPAATQLPVSGSTTQIVPPPADKKGEITLGASFAWKGSSGLTVTRPTNGTYRLTFANAYSNSDDYFVMAQGMDHSSSASSYIRIARSAGHVDIIVKNQANDNAIDSGAIGIQIINHV
jgi:hypothetical protein